MKRWNNFLGLLFSHFHAFYIVPSLVLVMSREYLCRYTFIADKRASHKYIKCNRKYCMALAPLPEKVKLGSSQQSVERRKILRLKLLGLVDIIACCPFWLSFSALLRRRPTIKKDKYYSIAHGYRCNDTPGNCW